MNRLELRTDQVPDDLAGASYWDHIWMRERSRRFSTWSFYDYRFDLVFQRLIPRGSRVLEVGCGNSRWLPHFARRYGCEVWGVDYSEPGVALAKRNLEVDGVDGRIVLGDALVNGLIPEGYFDVLVSFGLVEHFSSASWVIRTMARYLKVGGIMVTSVPNLSGFVGWLHRAADQSVFQAHVVMRPCELDAAHGLAGLEVAVPATYFGVFSLGVVNFNRVRSFLAPWFDKILWTSVIIFQQVICAPFRVCGLYPETAIFSPWILGAYRRTGPAG